MQFLTIAFIALNATARIKMELRKVCAENFLSQTICKGSLNFTPEHSEYKPNIYKAKQKNLTLISRMKRVKNNSITKVCISGDRDD